MNELRRRLDTIMGWASDGKEGLSDQSPSSLQRKRFGWQIASRRIALLGNAMKFRCTCNTATWLLFRPTTILVASVLCRPLSPPPSAVVSQRLLIEENLGKLVHDFSPFADATSWRTSMHPRAADTHRPRWTQRQVHASGICPRPTSAVLAITTRPPTVVVSRGVIDRACGAVGSSSSLAELEGVSYVLVEVVVVSLLAI
ncbi:hypothetical protein C8R45DRAFT_1011200 [Mycena sanguinolenta]|nr:hypothetical protein C8R45DRAFT_1011200 [Mycena sanguinolenta]